MITIAPADVVIRPGCGKYERLAYERALRMHALADGPTGHPKGYRFDPAAAEWAIEFIERRCQHFKGEWAGQPLVLEEWQKFIQREVFGWKRADGTRLYRIAYTEIPRKNAKSTIASANALFLLVGDDEPGAEVYASATKEDQAKIVWEASRQMVKQDERLQQEIRIRQKALVCEETVSTFKPLGSDSDTLDGLNPHGNIVDELHAHKNRGLWDVLDTAMGSRRQPLTIAITTAGIYDPESIGWEKHDYAAKVLDGVIEDDTFFAFIAAADEGDDPFAPETWWRANPNLGVSVKESYLAEQAAKAQKQPSFLNTFLRLHLNIWTQQVTRWISPEAWSACSSPVDMSALAGRTCFAGIDLASTTDIAALSLVFPPSGNDKSTRVLWRFWVPEDLVRERALERRQPDYAAWVRDGWLLTTPGNVIDYAFIRTEIIELSKRFHIAEVGFDPWNARQIAVQLQGDGLMMTEVRQGFSTLSEPAKEFEKLVLSRQLAHGDNPVARWMVANMVIRADANGNIAPDKAKAAQKIDGPVATIIALSRVIVQSNNEPSYDIMFIG